MPTVVWASYTDPTKPDIIHNQIIRSDEYLEANRPGGRNEQQHSRAILIFLFTYWEAEIRPRLARAKGVAPNDIQSDIMGDLILQRDLSGLKLPWTLTIDVKRTLSMGSIGRIVAPLMILDDFQSSVEIENRLSQR
jgi:hypothetical protein